MKDSEKERGEREERDGEKREGKLRCERREERRRKEMGGIVSWGPKRDGRREKKKAENV